MCCARCGLAAICLAISVSTSFAADGPKKDYPVRTRRWRRYTCRMNFGCRIWNSIAR